MSYTKELAAFCANLTLSETPSDVRETVRWCVLDFLGCVLGSLIMEEETGRLAGYVRSLGDSEEATIIGLGLRTSGRSAALAHGAMAEMLEFQDTYGVAAFHPSSCIMPAALAMAEVRRSSGEELMAAVLAGYEGSMRLGAAVGQSCVDNGFMSTGTLGTFGAAIAAGKLLGLDGTGIANAMGIAGYLAPLSMSENFFGGYSIRPVNGGYAAKAGIEAALMAAQGYTGSHRILEGSGVPGRGFCSMVSGESQLDRITDRLGDCYYLREISFKPFPCCGLPQTAVEAAIDLTRRFQLQPADVERITVRTYASAAARVGNNFPSPSSSFVACQFSIPYLMASVVKHGEITLKQFTPSSIRDPEVLELSARVKTIESKELTRLALDGARPSIVEIMTTGGVGVSSRVDLRKGDPIRPMAAEELIDKFRGLALQVMDEASATGCENTVRRLEDLEDVSILVRELAGPRGCSS